MGHTIGTHSHSHVSLAREIINDDYIEKELVEIEKDMNNSLRNFSRDKTKKRHELSVSATKKLNKHNVKIIIKFE